MAQKKGQRGATSVAADDSEVVARVPLQAVLLADSFNLRFRPITLERPKVLLPLVNVPMIEYTLGWLDSVGVEEVFVFCCSHSQQVKDYLKESEWTKPTSRFSITTIESHDAISAGDALRVIYEKSVIRGDFVLISGDTISNMNLAQVLREHKERKKKDPLAVMTMIIKHSKASNLTHQTRFGTDEVLMAIDTQTKELIFYEDKVNPSQRAISIDKTLLADNTSVYLHNYKQDCYIDICSPEVLSLFMDNFDYQHLRRHFVKGLLVDDVEVGRLITIPAYSKVSLRPQPSIQDSDEELEYADASSAVIESPSITSMVSCRNAESTPNYSVMENSNSSEVGIAGVGYIWSTYEGEHEEEWRYSIAPIPEAKLTELSHVYHEEPDVSYQFVNNTPVSGELQLDSESTGFDDGDGGDYGDSADFDKEVEATFHRALIGVNQETVILEINSLRLSCNKSHADCVGALFFSVMKLGLEAPHSSNSELYQNIAKEINKWKDLLKHYLKSVDEEIEVILKFEEICSETATELSPLFCTILSYLYEKDILSEDAILSWASEKGGADESDKIFVTQSESFITWLREASEEEDEDDE